MAAVREHRPVLLVGSFPGDDDASTMELAVRRLGPLLRYLPEGETGERANYVEHVVELQAANAAARAAERPDEPAAFLVNAGDWSTMATRTTLRVRPGYRLTAGDLELPYARYPIANFASGREILHRAGLDGVRHQVSIPTPISMDFVMLGPTAMPTRSSFARPDFWRGLRAIGRNYRAFAEATAGEIRKVVEKLPADKVLFQLEATADMVAVTKAPAPLRPIAARSFARRLADLVATAPAGTQFGVHCCLGSMNNTADMAMSDTRPLVLLVNAVTRYWPADRGLRYVHGPFATSSSPAPTDPAFYRPLRRLRMPVDTVLFAGVVHESLPEDDDAAFEQQRTSLRLVDEFSGRRAGVARACGYGRCVRSAAETGLDRSARLAREA
jgi:hypothetical protein